MILGKKMTTNRMSLVVFGRHLFGDRNAREVADPLAGTGQMIEQRGLAAVRVTDEGDGKRPRVGIHFSATRLSRILLASSRRRQIS
jgi:hypothetical protein